MVKHVAGNRSVSGCVTCRLPVRLCHVSFDPGNMNENDMCVGETLPSEDGNPVCFPSCVTLAARRGIQMTYKLL